jgi:hypothetical protein
MNQICCLNPDCHNPPVPDTTKFCPNCGVPLVVLRNRYRPVKPLGGGGFGKTYLAEVEDEIGKSLCNLFPSCSSFFRGSFFSDLCVTNHH